MHASNFTHLILQTRKIVQQPCNFITLSCTIEAANLYEHDKRLLVIEEK